MMHALSVLCCLVAIAGCGGTSAANRRAVPKLDGCVAAGPRTRIVRLRTGDRAALLGRGADTVVLSNQSDRDLCAWLPFAGRLERAGYRVLLYDYTIASPWADAAVAARTATRLGARGVFLVGASEGAKSSLIAAAAHPGGVTAVVSLSAERSFADGTDVRPWAARLRLPVLFLTARGDPFAAADTPLLYAACGSPHKQLIRVAGDAHGVDLLSGAAAREARGAILRFLAANR
jgi:pimeloyl-ACP methyl ester carboxylesterase